jgi:hypothetical protein
MGKAILNEKQGSLVLILFGLPFVLAGTVVQFFTNNEVVQGEVDDSMFAMLFSNCFILFGLFIIVFGIKLYRAASLHLRLQKDFPNEPWKWNIKWVDGRIDPERKHHIFLGLFLICVWFGILFVVAMLMGEDLHSDPFIFYLLAGLGLLGVLFIFFWVRSIFRYIKFGKSQLLLQTFPGIIGGEINGAVLAPAHLRPESAVHVQLKCQVTRVEGYGESRKIKLDTKFTGDALVNLDVLKMDRNSTVISFEIEIPNGLPESSSEVLWSLTFTCSSVGIDWSEYYRVPVFNRVNQQEIIS